MDRKALCITLLAATLAGPVAAVETPRSSPYDYRIKSVVYNPQDTVIVDAVVGLATHITVSPGERYVTHVFGDSDAWSFAHVENHFFIKPKEAHGDTNLTIVTDKRTYHILLRYIGDYQARGENGRQETRFIRTPWSMRQATLELTFTYPFEEAQRRTQRANRHVCNRHLLLRSLRLVVGISVIKCPMSRPLAQLRPSMCGTTIVLPTSNSRPMQNCQPSLSSARMGRKAQ